MNPMPLLFAAGLLAAPPAGPDAAGVEFFEAKVRPVFVEHCHKCHAAGAKAVKGGLRLDTRDGLLKGGQSGPAVVPRKPAESLLAKAVRHADDVSAMPPDGKLPDAAVRDIEKWIAAGAPLPAAATVPDPAHGARSHWAFRPINPPPVPAGVNPIDFLIEAKLAARGLSLSPPADRRTLLRRVYFDLIGLPPTWEQVQDFEKDDSPDAFEKVVGRLLASPRYGERWGRHWLDVARFADSKDGVLMYGEDRVRPFAYTYRDYVIRAFNEDLPFDRLVHEQLAADLIEPTDEPWRLAALGFLTLGRQFDSNVHDVIDDRIDTVTRGLLGLTMACARCHDHKYDPVPTADYYSLYGVFANCEQPLELPLLDPAARGPTEFEKKYAEQLADIRKTLDAQYVMLSETARARAADYLVHVAATKPDPLETAVYFLSLAPEDLRPPIVARWRNLLARRARPGDPVFGPWHDLFALTDDRFAAEAPGVVERLGAGVNPLVREALAAAAPKSRADVARAYGTLLKKVYDDSKAAPASANPARRPLLDLLTGPHSPAYFPKDLTRNYMSRADKDAFGGKLQALDKLAVREPNAPPRAMALADAAEQPDPRVFVRGNPALPGETVPRRFLSVLAGDSRKPFTHGSGRLDLAKAITALDNPLTARVIVNRVWMHHFGEPFVSTPNDFGLRSSPPTHPELLDWLAATLVKDGWSLKALHRRIVLSRAYQQASADRPACRAVDSENRLLWRANRRRLDMEAMRDALLKVSGRIEHQLYGRPVDAAGDPKNRRRTVYGLVDRQSLPGVYRAFDFASPDQSAERRPQTTVPQQALFGMNSPFVTEQAAALAALADDPDQAARVRALYRRALARDPDADEVRIGQEFVAAAGAGGSRLTPWQQLAQVLLLTNEFLFVD